MLARAWKISKRWGWRASRLLLIFLLIYALFLVIGLIPLNRGFQPTKGGVPIFVVSSSIHADIIVPLEDDVWDWRETFPVRDLAGQAEGTTHLAIGWGDRGFYLDTPEWSDLKASTALTAMFLPSRSVMHVVYLKLPDRVPTGLEAEQVTISKEQYLRLCESISASLKSDPNGDPLPIPDSAFHDRDAFYQARGSYHCFNTCNSWVGRRLAETGVTTPLFSPLPKSPLMYLEQ